MSTVDESRPVREEDAFDVAAVEQWLDRGRIAEVRQFPGGASNLTYLLRMAEGPELILRRPPAGTKARGAHDMGREFRIQSALEPVFPQVPTMVAHCTEDESPIGSELYVMERLVGLIPRRDFGFPVSAEQADRLCDAAVDTLVALHSIDVAAVPGLAALNKGEGYVARQVGGWIKRLENARTDDTGDWSDITAWLDEHQPADVGSSMIHNDYRLDNMVLDADDPTRIIGVLDWELATVGDPLMDLGCTLAYWVQADDDEFFRMTRRQPTAEPGMWTRQQVIDAYLERRGMSLTPEEWRFYEVFGLFRFAVIAQQIWYRYFHGQTTNEAYAAFGPAVAGFEARCRRILGG
ncbi:aminoglycoside phosphotransferase (APT) family kinase protein [Nocardioides sp. J9]|uniref:phosphotransferase family protein n=1 Tax=Nocardioides sp. J9 TaxID=935844 RepID=UPI00119D96F6|nr:phosphotransferase family protein [Nocardioides sp. J9]TWG98161.1 aminoglycoside phosphotransferase (APT) family kinase protein [Nocardioides sp. J9]